MEKNYVGETHQPFLFINPDYFYDTVIITLNFTLKNQDCQECKLVWTNCKTCELYYTQLVVSHVGTYMHISAFPSKPSKAINQQKTKMQNPHILLPLILQTAIILRTMLHEDNTSWYNSRKTRVKHTSSNEATNFSYSFHGF